MSDDRDRSRSGPGGRRRRPRGGGGSERSHVRPDRKVGNDRNRSQKFQEKPEKSFFFLENGK